MAVGQERINVKGFRELNRAWKVADKSLAKEYRAALRDVGEPVRADAERLALQEIPRIALATSTIPWHTMRVGITQKLVYVAPKQRSRNQQRRRPKFGTKLMEEAMTPALERNIGEAERRFDKMLVTVGRDWERG